MRNIIVGFVLGIVAMFGIARACEGPIPEPLKYTEFVVDTIVSEPDTIVQFVERIVYREVEPEYVATQPEGAVDRVEDFCSPDTIIEIVRGDTVYVEVPTQVVVSAVDTDAPWIFGKENVNVYGFDNAGDRREYSFRSWPGWQFATGQEILFQEPRFGWMKPVFKFALPLAIGWFGHDVIR